MDLPVKRIPREVTVEVVPRGLFGFPGFLPRREIRRTYTVIAVNVGGCLVPTGLALPALVPALAAALMALVLA